MEKSAFNIDWANPDYTDVFEFRKESIMRLRENPQKLEVIKKFYKENWSDFILILG